MLPKPRTSQPSTLRHLQRQLLILQRPMFWGTAATVLLSGFFLLEYWQPKSALDRSTTDSLPQNNLHDRSPVGDPARFNSGALPALPQPEFPAKANAPVLLDPTLPLVPAQLPPEEAETQTDRSPSSRTSAFSPSSGSRLARERSRDLYNPTGILMPGSWQRRSPLLPPLEPPLEPSSPQPSTPPQPEPAAGTAVSPLQSAFDRVNAPAGNLPSNSNPATNLSEFSPSPGLLQPSELPRSSGQVGTSEPLETVTPIPAQPLLPNSQPSPRTSGYTTPPAFRTPQNTAPFYNSSPDRNSDRSTSDHSVDHSVQPGSLDRLPSTPSLVSPSEVPQSSSGQTPRSASFRGIGGGEINTFSNP